MFTVELHMPPVSTEDDGGFARLRTALDLVPGSHLLEDPVDPTIVVPVEAPTAARAHLFAEAVLADAGLTAHRVTITELDDDDIDYAALGLDIPEQAADHALPDRAEQLQRWANNVAAAV